MSRRLRLRCGAVRGNRRLAAVLAATALVLAATGGAQAVAPASAADDTYAVAEDATLEVAAPGVLENDGTPGDGNVLCVGGADTANLHGSLDWAADGSFTYTPTANYNGAGSGNSFSYTMFEVLADAPCEGGAGTTATVEITVTPVNDAPTAAGDSFSVVKNITLNVAAPGVLRNDHDIDGDTLTAVKVSNPSHGVVILAADGSFSYTPASNYVGPDAFSYKASDGTASSPTRVVSLTVTAIPPIATPTPIPTPVPTLTPIETPEVTILEPSPSPEVSPSVEPSASPLETVAPSTSPSPSPGSSEAPGPTDSEGGGISLPVLLVIILFVLLVGFGAALYIPKWLAAQRGEPTDLG
jgi:Bacterial Ig domain/Bacterial cadherin-like domain